MKGIKNKSTCAALRKLLLSSAGLPETLEGYRRLSPNSSCHRRPWLPRLSHHRPRKVPSSLSPPLPITVRPIICVGSLWFPAILLPALDLLQPGTAYIDLGRVQI